MPKIIAYTALHYGKDYLASAIRSVIDHVQEYHVLYTREGSHGHRTDVKCPDSEGELYDIAERAAVSKLRWHRGTWAHEGQQRDSIHLYAPDADVILVVDSDEIWNDGLAEYAVKHALANNVREWRAPMVHFWRSMHKAILHDPAFPVRVIRPSVPANGSVFYLNMLRSESEVSRELDLRVPIAHMGYAQCSEIVHYKLLTHGHRNEFRRDVDWFKDKFMANAQHDTHVVGSEFWNPEPVNPLDYMPQWMSQHPYFNLEVIP